jgi:hypothetical protein
MQIVRLIFSVVAGVFLGSLIIYALQPVGQLMFPPPDSYDPADPDIFRKLTSGQKYLVLLPVLVAYLAGSVAGGFFAGILNKGTGPTAPLSAGLIMMGFTLITLLDFYHPIWFWLSAVLIYISFSLLGGILSGRVKKS